MASKRKKQKQNRGAKNTRSSANKRTRSSVNIWFIVGAVGLLAVAAIYMSLGQSTQVATEQYEEYPVEWVNRNSLGNPDASVTIEAWDDFL